MASKMLEGVLALGISLERTRDYNKSDLEKLMWSYDMFEVVKNDFIKGLITFDEFIQLSESLGIDPDEYLDSIEKNLNILKLI